MRYKIISFILTSILILMLIALFIWGYFFVEDISSKISIFGIVSVLLTAFTSVIAVILNNREAKEREYDLIVLKEKQKVFDHFYNAFFDTLYSAKNNKPLPKNTESELMNFKKGLMNWGSEKIIRAYFNYEHIIICKDNQDNPKAIIEAADKFLKEIRKEMNHEISDNINILSLILKPEARKGLNI